MSAVSMESEPPIRSRKPDTSRNDVLDDPENGPKSPITSTTPSSLSKKVLGELEAHGAPASSSDMALWSFSLRGTQV